MFEEVQAVQGREEDPHQIREKSMHEAVHVTPHLRVSIQECRRLNYGEKRKNQMFKME